MATKNTAPRQNAEGTDEARARLQNESDAAVIARLTGAEARAALYLLTRSAPASSRQVALAAGLKGGKRSGIRVRDAVFRKLPPELVTPADRPNPTPRAESRSSSPASSSPPEVTLGGHPVTGSHSRTSDPAREKGPSPIAHAMQQEQLEVAARYGIKATEKVRRGLAEHHSDRPAADLDRLLSARPELGPPGLAEYVICSPDPAATEQPRATRSAAVVARYQELVHARPDVVDDEERWRIAHRQAAMCGAPPELVEEFRALRAGGSESESSPYDRARTII